MRSSSKILWQVKDQILGLLTTKASAESTEALNEAAGSNFGRSEIRGIEGILLQLQDYLWIGWLLADSFLQITRAKNVLIYLGFSLIPTISATPSKISFVQVYTNEPQKDKKVKVQITI